MDMPDELDRRAVALLTGDPSWVPPPVRDAATVVLCRDVVGPQGHAGVEVFMMRRVRAMAFAAGMHVFPGGAVEQADADVPWGPGQQVDAERLTAPPALARSLVVAAVRETFEECGVLLAVRDDGQPFLPDDEALTRLEEQRVALLAGDLSFAALLREHGLGVDTARLAPWDHWITPAVENRRYDTRFFVAAMPPGQRARDLGGEADHVRWVAPAEAVAACRAGEMAMLPPTYATLESLVALTSSGAVLAAADGRRLRPLLPTPTLGPDGSVTWALVDARDGSVVGDA